MESRMSRIGAILPTLARKEDLALLDCKLSEKISNLEFKVEAKLNAFEIKVETKLNAFDAKIITVTIGIWMRIAICATICVALPWMRLQVRR